MFIDISGVIHRINKLEGKEQYPEVQVVILTNSFKGKDYFIAISAKNEMIDIVKEQFAVGDDVKIKASINSSYWEQGDKWFTNISINTIESNNLKEKKDLPF